MLVLQKNTANVAYIVNELENTISIHDLTTTSSPPTTSYSVLPSDVTSSTKSQMCASSINITSNNRHIYVTNRLESNPKGDAIVWFDISQDGKELTRKGEIRTGLDHPRAAEIFRCENNDNHDGKEFYIVGSKTEKGAVVYGIDGNTGELKEVARNMEVLSPSGFALV